jgi:hypothetical protein
MSDTATGMQIRLSALNSSALPPTETCMYVRSLQGWPTYVPADAKVPLNPAMIYIMRMNTLDNGARVREVRRSVTDLHGCEQVSNVHCTLVQEFAEALITFREQCRRDPSAETAAHVASFLMWGGFLFHSPAKCTAERRAFGPVHCAEPQMWKALGEQHSTHCFTSLVNRSLCSYDSDRNYCSSPFSFNRRSSRRVTCSNSA